MRALIYGERVQYTLWNSLGMIKKLFAEPLPVLYTNVQYTTYTEDHNEQSLSNNIRTRKYKMIISIMNKALRPKQCSAPII